MNNEASLEVRFDGGASCQELEMIKCLSQVIESFESVLSEEEVIRGAVYCTDIHRSKYYDEKKMRAVIGG